MTTKRQSYRWLLDLSLFLAFVMTFFLDFTGLTLHQLLGVAVGVVTLYHLATHWAWVKVVTVRLFNVKSEQSRLYYLVDATLMLGFALIGVTGLAISSWLDLSLARYDLWLSVHIYSSIVSMLLLVVKLGLHWRWIVGVFRKMVAGPAAAPRPVPATQSALGRREFLKMMGVVSAFAAVPLVKSLSAFASSVETEAAVSSDAFVSEEFFASAVEVSTTLSESSSTAKSSAAEATPEASATAEAEADAELDSGSSSPSSNESTTSCVVRCDRGCAFPGHCRKYTDANGNGLCDLGECL